MVSIILYFMAAIVLTVILSILAHAYSVNRVKDTWVDRKLALQLAGLKWWIGFLMPLWGLLIVLAVIHVKYHISFIPREWSVQQSQDSLQSSEVVNLLPSLDKTRILLDAIAEVESGNDTTAKNAHSTASGHLQITKGCLDEANNIVGYKKYSYDDRHSRKEAEEVFVLIQNKYNKKGDLEKAIRLWNGGPGYTVDGTQGYYEKVIRVYNRKMDEYLDQIIRTSKSLSLR